MLSPVFDENNPNFGKLQRTNFSQIQNEFLERSGDLTNIEFRLYLYFCQGLNSKRFEGDRPDERVWRANKTIMQDCSFISRHQQIPEALNVLQQLGWLRHGMEYPPMIDAKTGLAIPGKFYPTQCRMIRISFDGFQDARTYEQNLRDVQESRRIKGDKIQAGIAKSKAKQASDQAILDAHQNDTEKWVKGPDGRWSNVEDSNIGERGT